MFNTVERGLGWGGGGGCKHFNVAVEENVDRAFKLPIFRRSSQRSGDRKGKRHGKRAEATINSPAEGKRVNLVKGEEIVKITYLKRQMEPLENLCLTKCSFMGV